MVGYPDFLKRKPEAVDKEYEVACPLPLPQLRPGLYKTPIETSNHCREGSQSPS